MFGKQQSSHKGSPFGWGGWVLIFGLGLLFFLVQLTSFSTFQNQAAETATPPAEQSTPPQDSASGEAKEPPEEPSLLAEYNAQGSPFLDDAADDNRPLWLSGGELILKLLLVLGLVYLALLGLRWLQRGQRKLVANGTTIRVLETTGLAPGRALHLVIVGEKTLLIGATDHQISLLAELADMATPLVEESSSFAETLAVAQKQNPLDWQIALDNLRASVQRIRQGG